MEKAVDNQAKIQDIRKRMLSGEITYDEAKAEADPIIDEIYERAKVIAKKYNQRATRLSFAALMR
jgi:polyhydroxyalkanoate synthesis regulator phasin